MDKAGYKIIYVLILHVFVYVFVRVCTGNKILIVCIYYNAMDGINMFVLFFTNFNKMYILNILSALAIQTCK